MITHNTETFDTDASLVIQVLDSLFLKELEDGTYSETRNGSGLFSPLSVYIMASGFMTVAAWPVPGTLAGNADGF